jgi:hypothetical protein
LEGESVRRFPISPVRSRLLLVSKLRFLFCIFLPFVQRLACRTRDRLPQWIEKAERKRKRKRTGCRSELYGRGKSLRLGAPQKQASETGDIAQ